MNHQDRIVVDPDVLAGKPVVKGTRLSVDFLLGLLAQGWAEPEILRNYPGLEREDLRACWAYAAEALSQERVQAVARIVPATAPATSLYKNSWNSRFEDWMRTVDARAGRYPVGFTLDDSRESMYDGRAA
jgi:uncharacterized protein (DUF433 family)